jgi:hypothetical protein
MQLFESMVQMDDSMIKILQKVNHPVSDKILSLVDDEGMIQTKTDMKDTNLIMVGDTPDSVIYQREGRPLNLNDKIKIGRWVKKVDDEFQSDQIESFINAYKAVYIGKTIEPQIIKGEELRRSFLKDFMLAETGDFSDNCMRFDYCQPFLDIYAKNKDRISAAVIRDSDNKILARGILWLTDQNEIVMDRVYSVEPSWKNLLKNWAKEQGYYYRAKDDSKPMNATLFMYNGQMIEEKFSVSLENYNLRNYPFLDTFCYMDEEGTLYNYIPKEIAYKELRSAYGYVSTEVSYEWYIDKEAKTIEQIKQFMEMGNCNYYDINDDLSVNINETFILPFKNIRKLPIRIKFMNGNLDLSNNNLETLAGLPDIVYGNLNLSGNHRLVNLQGCPHTIRGHFDVSDCYLNTLEGGPKQVGSKAIVADYNVRDNELKDLKGLPQYITGDLIIGKQKSNTDFKKINIEEFCDVQGNIVF